MKKRYIVTAIVVLVLSITFAYSDDDYKFEFTTVSDIVKKVKSRFGEIDSYGARFKITVEYQGKKTVQTGYVKSKNPNLLAVDFYVPRGQKIVSNGKQMWIYIPSMNVVAEQDLKDDRGTVFSSGTKSGLQRLFSKYHYKFADKEQPRKMKNGKSYYTLYLQQKESRSGYRSINLWINEDFMIEKAVGVTSSNKKVTVEFSKIDTSKKYQKGIFKFDIPSNARVIKNPMLTEE